MATDIEKALRTDRTIDIVTVGRKTGKKRTTEIWFTNIDGRIIICGTPSSDGNLGKRRPRDWLANLKARPEFVRHEKRFNVLNRRDSFAGTLV